MHIFIDESGTFKILDGKRSLVCCVAALVVPSSRVDALFSEFMRIRQGWPAGQEEVKGSKLDEEQIASVIDAVAKYDAVLRISAADTGRHRMDQVLLAQADHVNGLRASIDPERYPNAVSRVREVADKTERLPPQLLLQLYATVNAVNQVLDDAVPYYAQRLPTDLSEFCWVLDRKDIGRTPFEILWTEIACPFIETWSLSRTRGTPVFARFDYSHLARFLVAREQLSSDVREEFDHRRAKYAGAAQLVMNLDTMVRDRTVFEDSRQHPGLQLVDILGSAFTRAMNGRLGRAGWRHLGRLMVREKHRPPAVLLLATGRATGQRPLDDAR